MTENKITARWRGRDIMDLSRDELIEALIWAAKHIDYQSKNHRREMEFMGDLRRAIT